MKRTLVALFNDLGTARNAVNELVNAGFDRTSIGLATYNETEGDVTYVDAEDVKADEGAGFGALVGGLTGLVAGLATIAIPGIGPIIAAGPLAAAMGGAAGAVIGAGAGAATGGLTAALVGMGVPDEEAGYYTEGIRRGGALVTATVDEERSGMAIDIMNRFDPVNVEDRTNQWRSEGWTGWSETSSPFTAQDRIRERQRPSTRTSMDSTPNEYNRSSVRTYNYEGDV